MRRKIGQLYIWASPGWVGVRRAVPLSTYYVLRDTRRHKPLFSERNGYRPFVVKKAFGSWQLGYFAGKRA